MKDHVLQFELTNARVEDCTSTSYTAAKKPRRECHSWMEEFPGIQRSVVLLCSACFDLLHFLLCLMTFGTHVSGKWHHGQEVANCDFNNKLCVM